MSASSLNRLRVIAKGRGTFRVTGDNAEELRRHIANVVAEVDRLRRINGELARELAEKQIMSEIEKGAGAANADGESAMDSRPTSAPCSLPEYRQLCDVETAARRMLRTEDYDGYVNEILKMRDELTKLDNIRRIAAENPSVLEEPR